ncbi:MAG: NAD(+) diphosphatase [Syntrophorhabdaceae bacterium]|nr:NAD(+) diphosphatase [Syntrophorhabdales bacterium]MBP9561282.1 NAD(+) diphosphatase [Syntrophorhabdaceae bacterium]
MDSKFIPSNIAPDTLKSPAYWFIFKTNKLLVKAVGHEAMVPIMIHPQEMNIKPVRIHYLGRLEDRDCFAADIPESQPIVGDLALQSLWYLYDYLDNDLFNVAIRAKQIINWDRTDVFCSRCGSRVKDKDRVRAKECPECGLVVFPRISPAIIVLIEKEKKILLAKSVRFKEDIYSILAGFVEPGETLEDAVEREVKEEVGIKVKDIRYFGSQPWPFPDSLMIGFVARYKSGRISIDKEEIVDARWFSPDNLPNIPGNISIARRMIDWFLNRYKTG